MRASLESPPDKKPAPENLQPGIPAHMARRAEAAAVAKSELPTLSLFVLAGLAGAFIALGCIFATVATTGAGDLPFGVARILGGLVFSLGLILVVVAGAELFTGDNLMVMAVASRRISLASLLRCWAIVYIGNFVGSVATAGLVVGSGIYESGGGSVGANAIAIAEAKLSLGWMEAVFRGVLCNALVCLAVWLCFSAHSTVDKVAAVVFPITAFVAAGFEHSIANMYFVPVAIMETGARSGLSWLDFLVHNLVPVSIGNIVGGAVLVGLVYWLIYLRRPTLEKTP